MNSAASRQLWRKRDALTVGLRLALARPPLLTGQREALIGIDANGRPGSSLSAGLRQGHRRVVTAGARQVCRASNMTGARQLDRALLMADLCGYTALAETHGALAASETVLRFVHLARSCLESGVVIVDSIGDAVFCAGEDTLAVVTTAINLRDAIEREPEFPRASMAIHRGTVVEREGRLFGPPINLTARLVAHALGGQILCTEPIARAVGTPHGLEYRPVGARHFKNVIRSVTLFELAPRSAGQAPSLIDPVCRMQVASDGAAAVIAHQGRTYHFCSAVCARLFAEAPGLYIGEVG